MVSIDRKDGLYDFLRKYIDLIVRASYGKVEVFGRESLPKDGCIIFAPNHCNTLMDALVVLQSDKGPTAFGARADIFRKPKIAELLRWLRIVPLARIRDGVDSLRGNESVFSEVADCLLKGVPFCIFPEGTHHVGYEVHPAKGGIYHIAQQAVEKGAEKVWIVPVGLSYSDFYNYRGDVTLRFGEAMDYADFEDLTPRQRCDKLTQAIQELVIKPEDAVEPGRKRDFMGVLSRIASLPLLLFFGALSLTVWLPAELIIRKMKDKAWSNTVRFGCTLVLVPLTLLLAAAPALLLLGFKYGLGLLVLLAFAPFVFYDVLRW